MSENLLYYTEAETAGFSVYLAGTDEGLCFVGSSPKNFSELTNWADHTFGKEVKLLENREKLAPYTIQLTEYFESSRKDFDLPLHLVGSVFQKEVWKALIDIPYGTTHSYGEVAESIGRSRQAARAVGRAISQNPVMVVIPCHRVIAKSGHLTGFRGGIQMKEDLLSLENRNKAK